MSMNRFVLMMPLLLGVAAMSPSCALDLDEPSANQSPTQETRAVTLDITGMT
jgi:hypothetical protein